MLPPFATVSPTHNVQCLSINREATIKKESTMLEELPQILGLFLYFMSLLFLHTLFALAQPLLFPLSRPSYLGASFPSLSLPLA